MSIDDNLKVAKLIDTYGKLLTDKQLSIVTSYYFDNLTLAEIGQNEDVSRQAVSDSISKSIKTMQYYEDNLHCMERYETIESMLLSFIGDHPETREQLLDIIDYIRS